jgi:hypothetical protein
VGRRRVKKAVHTVTGEKVALKIIDKAKVSGFERWPCLMWPMIRQVMM